LNSINILKRIKSKIFWLIKYKPLQKPEWHTIEAGAAKGLEIFITRNAFEGWDEMIRGTFDSFWHKRLQNMNLKPKVVFDIGAHFGYHTLAMHHMFSDANIYCFEPNPENVKRLQKHIERNKISSHIIISDLALAEKEGLDVFHISANVESSQSTGSYLGTVTPPLSSEHYTSFFEIEVKIQTLDNYCREHKLKPELIKIDVEGAEFKVLEGAWDVLNKYKPILCLEAHSIPLKDSIIEMLNPLYEIEILDTDEHRSFLLATPRG